MNREAPKGPSVISIKMFCDSLLSKLVKKTYLHETIFFYDEFHKNSHVPKQKK